MDVEKQVRALPFEDASLTDEDLYLKMKEIEAEIEFINLQTDFMREENKNLKKECIRAREEIKRIQSVPLVIGQFIEMVDLEHGTNPFLNLRAHQHHERLDLLRASAEHPGQREADNKLLGGAAQRLALGGGHPALGSRRRHPDDEGHREERRHLRRHRRLRPAEAGDPRSRMLFVTQIELPLTHGDLYAQIGIDPPRGVLLYGPPGTGKTMMAKAVANSTKASFIKVVGSEFVQKYLGEGAKMVRDVFRMARENAPSIIFVDEVDAIATKRFDSQTGADREVQRVLIELLTQMDGFDQTTNVKVIMATNRADTLDPALLRPGRLDRKVEFPNPDRRQKRLIFQTITQKMNLADDVDLENYVSRPEKISAADINAVCQEAGMQAVRKNRYVVTGKDFDAAYKLVVRKTTKDYTFYR